MPAIPWVFTWSSCGPVWHQELQTSPENVEWLIPGVSATNIQIQAWENRTQGSRLVPLRCRTGLRCLTQILEGSAPAVPRKRASER